MEEQTLFQVGDNPFRINHGDCKRCETKDIRLYWCHGCNGKFCWECLKEHPEG